MSNNNSELKTNKHNIQTSDKNITNKKNIYAEHKENIFPGDISDPNNQFRKVRKSEGDFRYSGSGSDPMQQKKYAAPLEQISHNSYQPMSHNSYQPMGNANSSVEAASVNARVTESRSKLIKSRL